MKRIIYLACFLGIISALAGGILAWVNDMTKERINELAIASEKENLIKIYPTANFEEAAFSDDSGMIEKLFKADNGAYIYKLNVYGYKDNISFLVALKDEKIDGYVVISVNDTPGYGSKVADEEYSEKVIGIGIDKEIPLISGATKSSSAVSSAIAVAIANYKSMGGK